MKLFRSSLLLAVLFGVDKLVGLLRQVLIGQTYGVTAALDAYNAANNLPDLVVTLLSGGAIAVAFIPVLGETLDREGNEAMWGLFSRVVNIACLIVIAAAVMLFIFAGPFVRFVVVPRFSPEQQALTAGLMRVNLLAMILFSFSGLTTSGLQSHNHFLLPGLAPILYNVGQIIGVQLLAQPFGIYGLAYGVILGAVLHLGIQLPGLVRYGFRWMPAIEWRHPRVVQVMRVVGPRILNLFVIQTIFITTDRFASGLSEGSVTALAYGWLIMQMPQTVIGTALATALLPTLSALVSKGDAAGLKTTLRQSLAALLALTIPATIAGMILVRPVVRLVFEGRAFTAEGTDLVVAAALMFLPGIAGHSLVEIAVRTFYARQSPWLPLVGAILTALTFAGLCVLLVPPLGHAGIALANTLAFTVEAAGLLWLLRWQRIL
jgi:putative peptidoglycan lipid II flippase